MNSGSAITSWVFLRAIALVYVMAFSSIAVQARMLWGQKGILPIDAYLNAVEKSVHFPLLRVPTVFWFANGDAWISGVAWLGVAAAIFAFAGVLQGWMFAICFFLYLSYSTAGQEFLSFQWDSLLLEAGFLALFAAPYLTVFAPLRAFDPPLVVKWMYFFLLFKLMFLSGVAKLESGDASWRDLTALSYHYFTQPLPNPVAPFIHWMPMWFHRIETALTFLIELALPFLIFWHRTRIIAATGFILLSLLIITTGNFAFFNWLTLALTVWLIPERIWSQLRDYLPLTVSSVPVSKNLLIATSVAFIPLFFLSAFWCLRWALPEGLQKFVWPVAKWAYEYRVSGLYGLFATMTKARPEIIIEGSNDGHTWLEYDLYYKPGALDKAPPFVAPHQPRLDWQMWFAALGPYDNSPWFQNFQARLLEGSPEVLSSIKTNPFPDHPPQKIRATLYLYEFAPPSDIVRAGQWWIRKEISAFGPVLERTNVSR